MFYNTIVYRDTNNWIDICSIIVWSFLQTQRVLAFLKSPVAELRHAGAKAVETFTASRAADTINRWGEERGDMGYHIFIQKLNGGTNSERCWHKLGVYVPKQSRYMKEHHYSTGKPYENWRWNWRWDYMRRVETNGIILALLFIMICITYVNWMLTIDCRLYTPLREMATNLEEDSERRGAIEAIYRFDHVYLFNLAKLCKFGRIASFLLKVLIWGALTGHGNIGLWMLGEAPMVRGASWEMLSFQIISPRSRSGWTRPSSRAHCIRAIGWSITRGNR